MAGVDLRTFFLDLDKCFTDEQRQNAVLLVKDIVGDVAKSITRMDQLLEELLERGAISKTDLSLLEIILETVQVSDALGVYEDFVSQLCPGTKEYTQHPACQDTFIGRKELLKSLLEFFQGQMHDTPPCLFLSGFPGVGKTRIAYQICDTLSSTAEVVFTDLRKITDVGTMIRSLIQKMDDSKQTYDQDTLDDLVKGFEKRKKEHIIVLDNAEDMLNPTSDPKTITGFMNCVEKMCENGHRDYLKIIITSRFQNPLKEGKLRRKLKVHVEERKVDKMCLSDAVEFIKYKSVNAELREGDPEKLAKLCGFCPLAMKLVAGRLKNKMVKPRDMIKLLDRSEESLRRKKRPGMRKMDIIHDPEVEYYEDMKFCIQRAFEFVTEDDRSLLLRLSVIPGSFSKDTAAAVGALEGPRDTDIRLQNLMYYNFVDVENPPQQKRTSAGQFEEPNRWRLHTLLKVFLQEKEKNSAEAEVLEEAKVSFVRHYAKVVKKIAASLDTDYSKAMRDIEDEEANIFHFFFLQHKVKTQPMDNMVNRTQAVYLLELVTNIPDRLDYFKRRAAKAKEDGNWRQYAEFRCWEALQYNGLGENTEMATSILEDVYHHLCKLPLEERKSVGGQLTYAHFYHIWGNVCVDNRDYAKGIKMLEKSVGIRQNILNRPDSALIKTLNDLGHAYYTCSQYSYPRKWSSLQLALKYYRMALELRERLSKNHDDTVIVYMNLGACYHSMKDYKKALNTYQDALSLNDQLHLMTTSIRATILKNMALSLLVLSELQDGFKNAKEAYEIMKQTENLRETARCLYLCGLLKMEMREYEEAEEYLKMQLKLEEELLSNGKPHSNDWQHLQETIIDLCTLTYSECRNYSDRFQNAEKAYENATRSGKTSRALGWRKRRRNSDSSYGSTAVHTATDTLPGFHDMWRNIFKVVVNSDVRRQWKTLGRSLGLRDVDVDTIEADNSQQLEEQCYQMLRQWKEASGAKVTPQVLIDTLRNEKFNKTADDVEKCLQCLHFDQH